MNDKILRALMQLSALVAQINNSHFRRNAHVIIKTYLEQSRGRFDSRVHIKLYFEYFNSYLLEAQKKFENSGLNVINQPLIHELCVPITSELQIQDRIVLFLSFLELVNLDQKVTSEEKEFISLLAREFNIGKSDYTNLWNLIIPKSPEETNTSDFLIVCDNESETAEELEGSWIQKNRPDAGNNAHLYQTRGFDGKIIILRLAQTEFFVLKYIGQQAVFLSNHRLEENKYYLLNPHDYLSIKQDLISYQDVSSTFKNEKNFVRLILQGKQVSLNPGKTDNSFSFSEESGNMVCITGELRTTDKVLHALSGRTKNFKGEICLNGYMVDKDYYRLQKLIGFVPASKIYSEQISVYQNLYSTAQLAFPRYTGSKLADIVEHTLYQCHLKEIQNLIPAKAKLAEFTLLQHHLLNLALELIRNPWVVFVSNPIEKLRAVDAELVLTILKSIASSGRLVIISSFQLTSVILNHCDRIWIFDDEEYLIYSGTSFDIFSYFKSFNTTFDSNDEICVNCGSLNPELVSHIIHQKLVDEKGNLTSKRKTSPVEWYHHFKEKIEQNINFHDCKKVLPVHQTAIPNIDQQYFVFFKNRIKSLIPRSRELAIRFMIVALSAFLLGIFLRTDWSAGYTLSENPNLHIFISISVLFHFMAGFYHGEKENFIEKRIIRQELLRNMSYFSLLNAQTSFLFFISLVESLIFAIISYFLLGLGKLIISYLIMFFTVSLLGNIVGICISNFTKRRPIAYFVFISFLLFNTIFNGITVDPKNYPDPLLSEAYVPLVADLSPARWATEALVVDQVINNDYESKYFSVDKSIQNSIYNANYLIPGLQQFLHQLENKTARIEKKWLIRLIRQEIDRIPNNYTDVYPFEYDDDLTPEKIKTDVINEASDYLTYLQIHFSDLTQKLIQQKNSIEKHLIDSMGSEKYAMWKKRNENSYLYNYLVLKKGMDNLYLTKNSIIKVMNPLFHLPESNLGRAHLFAPEKLFNGNYYQTYWFNEFILCLFIFLVYLVTLISFYKLYP